MKTSKSVCWHDANVARSTEFRLSSNSSGNVVGIPLPYPPEDIFHALEVATEQTSKNILLEGVSDVHPL